MRKVILIVLCLLSLAAVWYFWPAHDRSATVAKSSTPSPTAPVASAASAASNQLATASSAIHSVADLTNRLAFRLANTTRTLGELTVMPHAILLQNALLDTDAKLDLTIPKQLSADTEPGAFIVQARGVIDARFRAALAAAGGQIVSYIPNNAYLVRLSSAGAAVLSGNGLVQAVLPYEPYYKVNPTLLGRAVEQLPLTPGTALTLGLFATDTATAEKQLTALGAKVIGWDHSPFGPVLRVLPPKDWTALARSPLVQVMEPAHQRMAANDLARPTLGVATDSQTTSNYLDLTGANVLVAVNDSGVDATHPDLTLRVFGPDLTDTDGHGTHVAGIIAGDGTESMTVINAEGSLMPATNGQFRGMAPMASLFSFNYGHSDYVLQTNAAEKGALISNNSWTYGGDFDYDLAAASYDAATRDSLPYQPGSQPVLFVFAAGGAGSGNNDGSGGNSDTILSPGTAKNVITVGAMEQLRNITNIVTVVNADGTTNQSAYWQAGTDSGTQVASYSSRGNVGVGTEGTYGRFKPDVVAPGTFLVSTRSSQWDTNAFLNPTNVSVEAYPGQLVATNGLVYYNVTVPANVVKVTIAITPNKFSNPFPSDMPIYVQQSGYPDPVNAPGSIDITTMNNGVSIPPDSGGAIADITSIQNSGFDFAVGNSTNVPVNYDLTVAIYTTNNVGDLYEVLLGMDDQLGPWYRYETGTSMSAAGVSGVLALIQDYFTNTLQVVPSPALLKAMLINGSQEVGSYAYAVTNGINFQGWGSANIAGSLPLTSTNLATIGANSPLFFIDQSPTNALATGDSRTYIVTLNTANFANYLPLKATLVWTDPCGDPSAAIKLVNNLDLIITNLDTGEVYFGNNISSDTGYNLPWDTNGPPMLDSINNVENILISPNQELLAGSYSVTVVGRAVNVNAVTAQTNSVVQDYALVVTVGEGEVPDAITSVAEGLPFTNPTGGQLITVVTTTNSPLFNQIAGASSPLLGTNTLPLGTNTMWGGNGQLTVGMTNQWHFYIVTNNGPSADYTNAAFITFQASTLSIPRMGVYADTVANATRPEGDIDLYVATGPGSSGLTNLDPVIISNCLSGVAGGRSSLGQGGTEFTYYTDSAPGDVYYVGVKSEDREAVEYAFLPVFTSTPFSSLDDNGNQIVNGLLLPVQIPDGDNARPGVTNVFCLAIYPMQAGKVTVHSLIEHQNFGDLFGTLTFGTTSVVLNNHDGLGNTIGTAPLVYDDSRNPVALTRPTDGPGSLVDYRGKSALGPWILTELDNSQTQTGQVSQFTLVIQPHRKLLGGTIITVPAQGWFIDYVDVPPGYTNLTFNATNLSGAITPPLPPLQMYEKLGNEPTFTDFDQTAGMTNCLFGTYPLGLDPGNSISVGPPLDAGQYFIGIYNPSLFDATNVFVSADLSFDVNSSHTFAYNTNPAAILLDDAVSSSSLFVVATQLVSTVNVGLVVNSPRISDFTFTLVSPTGQRVLLMENRGDDSTNGAGGSLAYTNVVNSTATGGVAANTNYLEVSPLGGNVPITYDFYTVPDQMTVYDGTNISPAFLIFDSGFTNNLAGPVSINVASQPGYTNITIIMNQFGNPYGSGGDAWIYTAGAAVTNYQYLVFTDDTNLATVPIKFGAPPYNFTVENTNYTLSDFELATNGDYFGPTNVNDAFGGWDVPTNLVTVTTVLNLTNSQFELVTNVTVLTNNLVSVVMDPANSLGDNAGSNYLALAYGTITRSIPTIPGRRYNLRFWDRGPGIASWWRGEGNAGDSSDPEHNGNNGALVGRFNFPAGEVGQAFGFQDGGNEFQFAGTNTYVQVPQNPSLDVGRGGGFTVEGWINPTNLIQPQPLVEWLAHVPTNTLVTNLVIQAGPYLNPVTGHYYYMLGATNWTASENWAIALGGHLVTLEDANEQNWVVDNFANYGGVNHNLWIGLTNNPPATFGWVGGLTNVVYTNWQSSQPNNICGTANYTAMLGGSNALTGLWFLANNNGFTCAAPTVTNRIYGVVEVDDIQTNGVQFWISVTNTPGTTNLAFASTNGSLYANIVDTNFVAHEIYSAPGLLQSNVYQHVALTFNTNSGLAMLYLNGTNVAVTNLFLTTGTLVPFVPKTDGDVLLGRDMSRLTNNYYGGAMDEMSIYNRALSGAEIAGIHRVSALATNGLTGKFDASITPATGLSEAAVILGSSSNVIYGVNNQWQLNSYTFTATSNSMPLQITGLQPGILLDSFDVSEAPLTNLYYLPEQELSALTGTSAQGSWTLQVWDNRVDAYLTNLSQLVSWQLNFVLESNATIAASLAPESPTTTTVGPGQTLYYQVPVPAWAHFATNVLVSSTYPVDLYFNATNPPNGSNPNDITLLTASTGGTSPAVAVNLAPPFVGYQAGQSYYLGVHNPGIHAASVVLEVDYDLTALTNGVPYSDVLTTNASDAVRYFSFDVSSNAYEATFQLLNLSGNADLVVRKGVPLPTLTSSDYGSFNVTNLDEDIYVFTNSSPVPLSAGRWYLGVVRRDAGPMNFTVLAKELDLATAPPTIIELTNGIPVNFTAGPGAALTNFFHFPVTNMVVGGVTNQGLRFALYNQSGNGDLTVQTNALPLAPPFLQSSQNPGRSPELMLVFTNDAVTNLLADWYLGVPNNEKVPISYTIVAEIITNAYFPAFPGATGAGGGAVGGRFGTVYHVTSTGDSGPGTLRDAVNATNRTVVFDITGDINLLSPIVITNSYLTIAGQSAMCGGVTVAGQTMKVQSDHVIIRDVRFRPFGSTTAVQSVWSNGFEGNGTNIYSASVGDYFAGGWHVDQNNLDVLVTGYQGSTAYEGTHYIDLNGVDPATISTNLPTVTGQSYTLSFAYSQNPAGRTNGFPTAGVKLFENGNALLNLTLNLTANTWANLGWATTSVVFTATGPNTLIQFAGQYPGSYGVLLDDIRMGLNVTGTFSSGDSLQFLNASNVIADHVSASWSANNLVSVLNSANVTVQWSIMADSLFQTNSPQQGVGSLLRYGSGALSFHHNLYADNYSGNPQVGDNLSLDFVNNVIYGWGLFPGLSGGTNDLIASPTGATNQLNYACNYLIAGPDTARFATNYAITNIAFFGGGTNALAANWIFQTNNFMDSDTNRILNGANTQWRMFTNAYTRFEQPFPLIPVPTDEAFLAYEKVLDFAGVNMCQRDSVDADIVWKVRNQNGTLISVPPFSGLVSLWKGEFNADDSAGINNGTMLTGGGYGVGQVGEAFSLSGAPDFGAGQCVDIPYSPTLVNPQYTIDAWVKPTAQIANSPNFQVVIYGQSVGCVQLVLRPGTTGVKAVLQFKSTLGGFPGVISTGEIPLNQFTHLAGTWDGTTLRLYINGVLNNQLTPGQVPLDSGCDFFIGGFDIPGGAPCGFMGQYFPGLIDEVGYYSRALSPSEIQSIYLTGSSGAASAQSAMLPYLDTDRDGIPDFWEITFGQNPTNASNNQLSTNINYLGYTTLEEYLAWRAGPHALTVTNTPVDVDLYQLFGNTGHLGFSVGNGVNGTVYLTNNVDTNNVVIRSNTIAVFTPTNTTPPYSGYASFDVYVTNADTVAYFGPVTVSVVVSSVPILYANYTNSPPMLDTNLSDQAVDELATLVVTNTATDADPNQTLSYMISISIDTNAMIAKGWPLTYVTTTPGPVINANGVITWTPTETQGPGVYTITTIVTDDGIPPLTATNSFNVTVNETNTAPFWPTNVPSQTNYIIPALNLLVVTNTAMDSDIPPNPLTYQLFGPTNALIDANGIITWVPTLAQAPGVYIFTTVVTDTNQYALFNKSLSATNTFTVTVLTALAAPYAFTQPAQAVTGTSAQLNGMATPNGLPSVAWYEWGTSIAYGSNTPPVSVGAGFNVVYVPSPISGLTQNLPYHFRLVVSNAFAVVYGFDQILDEANVVAWGANYVGQISVPPSLTNAVAIAGAYDHSLALKNNGTVAAWGENTFGQATVPPGLNNVLAVAGGAYYSMALQNSGTVTAWGANILGQISVPPGLNNVVNISGGTYSSLALRNNGAIVAWGASFFNLTNVPVGLSNVVAIAGGGYHNLAIRNDGTVTAWGDDSANQTDVPVGLTNVVAIAGGSYHSLALRYDGTVVSWGDDSAGQTNVPPGLTNVVAVAAGGFHSLALKNDGSIVTWGDNTAGQISVPPSLTNSVAIASGYFHSLALTPQSIASLTNAIVLNLTNGVPQTNTVLGGSIVYYQVNVPTNADFATNSLLFTISGSLDVWFSTNMPPTIAGANDSLLLAGSTNGIAILSTLSAPTNIVPSTTYYLGINNTNSFSVNYGIEVDFHLTSTNPPPQTNTVPVSDIIFTNGGFLLTWFAPSNDLFQVQWSDNLPFTWQTFTNIISYNTNAFTSPTNTQFNFFDDGSQAPFTGSRFYQLILLGGPSAPNTPPVLPAQTNRVANLLNPFIVTNTAMDGDLPAQTLTYSLTSTVTGTNLPVINSAGIITWTPDLSQAGTSNVFTTIVTDNGTPAMSTTNSFAVIVSLVPDFSSVIYTNGGYLLTWFAPSNDLFHVQWSDSIPPVWQTFTNPPYVSYNPSGIITATNVEFDFFDDGSQTGGVLGGTRFYQLILIGSAVPLTNAPVISAPTSSQTAELGDAVKFTAQANGYPPLNFTWFFNGAPLVSTGRTNYLELNSVNFLASGTYAYVVTNVYGAATSGPIMLNVIIPVQRRWVPGIQLTGEVGSTLDVEYSDALDLTGSWQALGTITLTNPPDFAFDLSPSFPSYRFYRASQPAPASIIPLLSLYFVPAITLAGNIGDIKRLDYINQVGPTNAWNTLATLTLTNTTELYFDVSTINQPPRLYRIVPLP